MFLWDTLKKSCDDTVGAVSGGLEELIDDPCRADGLKSMSQVFSTCYGLTLHVRGLKPGHHI